MPPIHDDHMTSVCIKNIELKTNIKSLSNRSNPFEKQRKTFDFEIGHLKYENEKLVHQVNDLNAIILEFTKEQKSLDLLIGSEKQACDRYDIDFKKIVLSHLQSQI